jgi:tocopherol cyclase
MLQFRFFGGIIWLGSGAAGKQRFARPPKTNRAHQGFVYTLKIDPTSLRPARSILLLAAFWVGCMLLCPQFSFAQRGRKPQVMGGEKATGYRLRKTWKPAVFQGGRRKHDYYEGWYFKSVSADGKLSFALIPGIALGNKKGENAHAFIQYIDNKTAQTHWYEFPVDAFSYSQRNFAVRIGENYFSQDSVHVDVGEGADHLQVDLRLSDLHPWRVKAFSPGIMGPYRFVPGMETCHGLVSLAHRVDGQLTHAGATDVLVDGNGYIEKDWGSSFPRSYVWMQTNQFAERDASLMCSIATIPYLGKYFTGFLGFFYLKGKLYRFATYTHAHLEQLKLEEDAAQFTIREHRFSLEIRATRRSSGVLKAPQKGEMERRISESIDAEVHVKLMDRKGTVLFEGTGLSAGLEIVGNRAELME